MHLRRLKLLNFRNFERKEFEFGQRVNVIRGPNGVGKTNLLEAIAYLSLPRSFRRVRDRDLIRWGEKFFRLEGETESKNGEATIVVRYSDRGKLATLNGRQVPVSCLFSTFAVLPVNLREHLLVDGQPSLRRKTMDWLLSLYDPSYFALLLSYRRSLRHKNALLRSARRKDELKIWNERLEGAGRRIVKMREEFVRKLQPSFSRLAGRFLPQRSSRVRYVPSTSLAPGFLQEKLREELPRGYALYGPHRDDLEFLVDGRKPAVSASEGEKRLLILSFFLAVSEMLRERWGEYPVLAMDEPVSILGQGVAGALIQSLPGQVFLTTVRPIEGDYEEVCLT